MRIYAAVVALAFAVPVSASFEMLLAVDVTAHMVHRIDPTNHIYLGSFGVDRLSSPVSITTDQASGIAYVADQNRRSITSFDYNTGLLLNEFSVGMQAVSVKLATDGTLLVTGDAGARRYSASGSLLTTYRTTPSGAIFQGPTGEVYIADYLTGTPATEVLRRFTLAGSVQNSSVPFPSPFTHAFSAAARGQDMFLLDNTTNPRFMRVHAGNPATFDPSMATGPYTVMYGAAFGHGNTLWTAGVVNSSYKIVGYNTDLGLFDTGNQGYSQVTTIYSMASVIAPEPTSMLALGLGAAALIRKRRG